MDTNIGVHRHSRRIDQYLLAAFFAVTHRMLKMFQKAEAERSDFATDNARNYGDRRRQRGRQIFLAYLVAALLFILALAGFEADDGDPLLRHRRQDWLSAVFILTVALLNVRTNVAVHAPRNGLAPVSIWRARRVEDDRHASIQASPSCTPFKWAWPPSSSVGTPQRRRLPDLYAAPLQDIPDMPFHLVKSGLAVFVGAVTLTGSIAFSRLSEAGYPGAPHRYPGRDWMGTWEALIASILLIVSVRQSRNSSKRRIRPDLRLIVSLSGALSRFGDRRRRRTCSSMLNRHSRIRAAGVDGRFTRSQQKSQ